MQRKALTKATTRPTAIPELSVRCEQGAMLVQIIRPAAIRVGTTEENENSVADAARRVRTASLDDGRARARRAGYQRKSLRESHLQCVRPSACRRRCRCARAAGAARRKGISRRRDKRSHRPSMKEMRLDQAANASPSTAAGINAIARLSTNAPCEALVPMPVSAPMNARGLLPDDGEHRSGLDDEIEHLAFVIVEVEQLGDDDEGGRWRRWAGTR